MAQETLRDAITTDAPAIASLLRAAFEEYRGRLDPPSSSLDATVEQVLEKMLTARTTVAQYGPQIVGCIFEELQDEFLYFFSLAVLPRYRRRSLGRTLIGVVEKRARWLDLEGVCLGVRVALPELLSYYDRLGYRVREYCSHAGHPEPTYVILEKRFARSEQGTTREDAGA
jgi:ribosomal protein S18 acetylase RimI-like enzyme